MQPYFSSSPLAGILCKQSGHRKSILYAEYDFHKDRHGLYLTTQKPSKWTVKNLKLIFAIFHAKFLGQAQSSHASYMSKVHLLWWLCVISGLLFQLFQSFSSYSLSGYPFQLTQYSKGIKGVSMVFFIGCSPAFPYHSIINMGQWDTPTGNCVSFLAFPIGKLYHFYWIRILHNGMN